ncbi:MAG: biotin/lipoyl-binding protein [Bacteroidetes bacterium]|jgi:biotin carboxyl carrier protein|nr:biotin/lipoyl-binding protein [Bacteroidota bacterium]MBU1580442.1 biotin/lipoyl-binding protein [Bacteroidota bacterium]MBU2557111.1 biotin/lipoyl-binding protein [Bacteroidota bacterium]MDA3944126.1 biotin/lipoyl-binding protein [Bacteroidota bacterium]
MRSFKFSISGNNYEVDVLKLEGSYAEVEVNGTPYQIEIERQKNESKTPILVRPSRPNPSGSHEIKREEKDTKSALSKIMAPLPGNIMQVMVKSGDQVKRGDKLLIYEAMKMENNLLAEKDGLIKSVKVQVGDSVLQGDVLIEME